MIINIILKSHDEKGKYLRITKDLSLNPYENKYFVILDPRNKDKMMCETCELTRHEFKNISTKNIDRHRIVRDKTIFIYIESSIDKDEAIKIGLKEYHNIKDKSCFNETFIVENNYSL